MSGVVQMAKTGFRMVMRMRMIMMMMMMVMKSRGGSERRGPDDQDRFLPFFHFHFHLLEWLIANLLTAFKAYINSGKARVNPIWNV